MSSDFGSQGSSRKKTSRAQLLIRRLWSALETDEGRRLPSHEVSALLNLSDSSLSDWTVGKTELNQIEAVLRLCERLGHDRCFALFRQHLRLFPTLRSPELTHDPATADLLRQLLFQTKGLTFVFGSNDTRRTFVLTAMGRSYLEERTVSRALIGWDVHPASWFVPLPGVMYLKDSQVEPQPLGGEGHQQQLILSNGLWQRFEKHRAHLKRLALARHVIVADALIIESLSAELKGLQTSVHVLEVTGDAHCFQISLNVLR